MDSAQTRGFVEIIRASRYAPAAVIALLVFAQGGFFSLMPCLLGALLCVVLAMIWFRDPLRNQRTPWPPILLFGMVGAYVMSAVINGPSLTSLAETGSWVICAATCLWAASMDDEKKASSLTGLCLLFCATSILGFCVYAGLLTPLEGMVEDRLQFTFQYANAAAAWYAVGTFLCALSPNEGLRNLACIPVTALLLTQSAGCLIVFVPLSVVCGIMLAKCGKGHMAVNATLQGLLAIVAFALLHVPLRAAGLVAAGLVFVLWHRKGSEFVAWLYAWGLRRFFVVLGCLVVLLIALAVVILQRRMGQAATSFAERMYHVHDGLTLWKGQPLLGVGPDNWQYLYRYIQSAQYNTTVVHSSLVQILLDSGVMGFGFLVAACVAGIRNLWRTWRVEQDGWGLACLLSVIQLLAHSLLEFNLQFSSLACLLTWLLGMGDQSQLRSSFVNGLQSALAFMFVGLPICLLGCASILTLDGIQQSLQNQDYAACQRSFKNNPLAQIDVSAQECNLIALSVEGDNQGVVAAFSSMPVPTDASVLTAARAGYALGQRTEAGSVLIAHMNSEPFSVEYIRAANGIIREQGLDDAQVPEYRAAIERANELSAQVSAWLPQEYVDPVL